jgi:hypothetical protein
MLRRPMGGSGYGFARSFRFASFPRKTSATFCRPWKCCAFPYPGRQNVIYSRDVMCHNFLNRIMRRIRAAHKETAGKIKNVKHFVNPGS